MWEESGKSGKDAGCAGVHLLKGIIAQMFLGQYQHNLDEKGRLMIPARYRELLAAGAFITQGFDKCLMVMTDVYFKQVYDRINAMNLADQLHASCAASFFRMPIPLKWIRSGASLCHKIYVRSSSWIAKPLWPGRANTLKSGILPEWNAQINQLQDVETNNQRFATLDLSRGYLSS